MSKIWSIMIIVAIVFSMFTLSADKIIEIVTKASMSAIENVITLAGMMCFWSGMFNILNSTKTIDYISKIFNKILKPLFKKDEIDEDIMKDMSLNVASNAIGIGNAATIFGLKTIEKMQRKNINKEKPNDSMTMFILLNTASIQLIPTSIISLRMLYGSSNAGEVILPVWIVTILAMVAGIISMKILNRVIK